MKIIRVERDKLEKDKFEMLMLGVLRFIQEGEDVTIEVLPGKYRYFQDKLYEYLEYHRIGKFISCIKVVEITVN